VFKYISFFAYLCLVVSLINSTSAIDRLEGLVFRMTCFVSNGTLNLSHAIARF